MTRQTRREASLCERLSLRQRMKNWLFAFIRSQLKAWKTQPISGFLNSLFWNEPGKHTTVWLQHWWVTSQESFIELPVDQQFPSLKDIEFIPEFRPQSDFGYCSTKTGANRRVNTLWSMRASRGARARMGVRATVCGDPPPRSRPLGELPKRWVST